MDFKGVCFKSIPAERIRWGINLANLYVRERFTITDGLL
jgi:hypothetical protein